MFNELWVIKARPDRGGELTRPYFQHGWALPQDRSDGRACVFFEGRSARYPDRLLVSRINDGATRRLR
jgi:hypothetical protein